MPAASVLAVAPTNDSDRFAILLADLRPYLRERAWFMMQGDAAADDLVQDTIERALLCRHQFRNGTNIRAWTTSIMRNLFIDQRRRIQLFRDVDPEQVPQVDHEPESIGVLDLLSSDDLWNAVGRLTADDRRVFELAYLQRMPYRRLAASLGICVNTVGTRLYRIRAKLRVLLQRCYEGRLQDLDTAGRKPRRERARPG